MKRLDDQEKKKEAQIENQEDLKRKHMTGEIGNAERQKMAA